MTDEEEARVDALTAATLRREAPRPVRIAGFGRAGELWPAVGEGRILHGGPPLEGREPSAAARGAIVGALLLEGEARTHADAERLLDSGRYELVSCHTVGGVGAMTGIVTPSVPVVAFEREDGRRSYAPLNEGLGNALRFGNNDAETLDRLRHLAEVVAPALDRGLAETPPIDVIELQAEALRRGDECHNRNVAGTALFTTRIAAGVARANRPAEAAAALQALADNPHFFLCLSMGAAKNVADALHEQPIAGVVTGIAANGHGTGIRVAGLDRWIVRPAPPPIVRYFEGYSERDLGIVMGDSSVTETIGLGAMALTCAPGLVRTLEWEPERAREHVRDMQRICVTGSPVYEMPDSGFAGTPLGIDVRRALAAGSMPWCTAGFAHREVGGGRVGFGMMTVAAEAFEEAARRLDADDGTSG